MASSFDAAAFRRHLERQENEQAQALVEAADGLLPSSSESSGDDDAAAPGDADARSEPAARRGRQSVQQAERDPSGRGQKRKGSGGGSGGGGGSKRRHGRRREREGGEEAQPRLTELEKIYRSVRQAAATYGAARITSVKGWAQDDELRRGPDTFYLDGHGDYENAVYGGLYKMDLASYRREGVAFDASIPSVPQHLAKGRPTAAAALSVAGAARLARSSRYFAGRHVLRERSKRQRRLSILEPAKAANGRQLQLPLPSVLELRGDTSHGSVVLKLGKDGVPFAAPGAGGGEEGESVEELVLRRTKELSEETRRRPYDVQAWIEYARWQDEAMRRMGARRARGSEGATAEKKLAILGHALTHHPGNVQLVLMLMEAAAVVSGADELAERWEEVVRRYGGIAALWLRFVDQRKSFFAALAVEVVRDTLRRALHDLQRAAVAARGSEAQRQREEAVALLLVESCAFELSSGHRQRMLARMQAALEWLCFRPEPRAGGGAKDLRRLFRQFWCSCAPRVGEEGAKGWAAWLLLQPGHGALVLPYVVPLPGETEAPDPLEAEDSHADGPGPNAAAEPPGWVEVAWPEPSQDTAALLAQAAPEEAGDAAQQLADALDAGEEQAELQLDDAGLLAADIDSLLAEVSEEQLMKELGLQLDRQVEEQLARGVKPEVVASWIQQETAREAALWAPAVQGDDAGGGLQGAGVDWEMVQDCLVQLECEQAARKVAMGMLDALGLPVRGWSAASCPIRQQLAAGLGGSAAAFYSLAEPLQKVAELLGGSEPAGGLAGQLLMSDESNLVPGLLHPGEHAAADCSSSALPASTRSPGGSRVGDWLDTPWWARSEERREYAARLLAALLGTPLFRDSLPLCRALAWTLAVPLQNGPAPLPHPLAPTSLSEGARWAEAKAGLQRLLAGQRSNAAAAVAYAQLEAASSPRSLKAFRKVLDRLLASSGQLPPQQQALLPEAAMTYVSVECGAAAGAAAPPLHRQQAALRSAHVLAWLGLRSRGCAAAYEPALARPRQTDSPHALRAVAERLLAPEELLAARQGLQSLVPDALAANNGALCSRSHAVVCCVVFFELLCWRLRADGLLSEVDASIDTGPLPALTFLKQVEEQVPASTRTNSAFHERLAQLRARLVGELQLLQRRGGPSLHSLGGALVAPAAARQMMEADLQVHPASGALLVQLAGFDLRAFATARLRQLLRRHCEAHPCLPLPWLLAASLEELTSASSAARKHQVRGLLERGLAAADPSQARPGDADGLPLAHAPVLWRFYQSFEAAQADMEAAKRVFLRAVNQCAWSKPLWMSGLTMLCNFMPGKEMTDLIGVMRDKQLLVHTDVFESVLASLEQDAALPASDS